MDNDIPTYKALPAHGPDRLTATLAAPRPDSDRTEADTSQAQDVLKDRPPDSTGEVQREAEPTQDGYRLSFDSEKGRVYLELVNPTTGDVIQRLPRDDLKDTFKPDATGPLGSGVHGRLDVRI